MNWHQYFSYTEAGELIWKSRPLEHFKTASAWKVWNTKYLGRVAGYKRADGYITVGISRKLYLNHRIIFEMHDGELLPKEQVDHIDMNKSNNRRANLRRCSNAQNMMNTPPPRTNTSGYKGVHWNKLARKWTAVLTINGSTKRLGFFPTPEEAHVAYSAAAIEHHGEFARV